MVRPFARCFGILFLICSFSLFAADNKPDKPIRLRNETVRPQTVSKAITAESLSGLHLIQFHNSLQPSEREQLRAIGIELLRYVPDDAYVARFDKVPENSVRALEFVRYVGEFRPEHKVHRSVTEAAKSVGGPQPVSVLLIPSASEDEAANAKQSFTTIEQDSHSRAGRVLRGKATPAQIDALSKSDTVLWIEPHRPMKLFDEIASRIVAGDGPFHQTLMQSLGYTGAGVNVAVADSGLDSGDTNSMHPDIQGRVKALFYYDFLTDAADEHSHGTHVAGIVAGNGATGETDANNFLYGLGVAPGARLIAQRIFGPDGEYAQPPSFETLTRDAKRAGADVGSNSWGDDTQGRYDNSAMEFDALVRDADALTFGDQPYILEFSAGNAGPNYQTVGSPAVAKNVIATGASQNDRFDLPMEEFAIYADGRDAMADFSSRGPCEDGRIKPDLVAPGSWIASLRSIYANDNYAWWPISDYYMYQGGTSQAGPHVSGAAAVFVQYWRSTHAGVTPSPALVKAALINSATDMDDGITTDVVPNNDEGWGRVDLPALIASTRNYDFTDQSVLLTNGGFFEKRVLVGTGEPLKITLTYTDEPGLPAAVVALVNDLDLEVIGPDGHLYRGNRFEDGNSIPDAPLPDTINNVEAVHLLSPVAGEYIVRVRATRIAQDARIDSLPLDQDFALVISGQFVTPGIGMVTFDRKVYRAPDTIKLALVDYNLAGQPNAHVLLRSGAEPAGENITLLPNGSSGVFTGAVATLSGTAVADGKLQIAHNNTIEAVYSDAAPATNRIFTARADLQAPIISNLIATNQFGQVTVSWLTDEDARAEVYYGTNLLNTSLTNRSFDLDHEFSLSGLRANAVAKFFVVSQDEAGNRSTNNNGGAFFTITNVQPPGILFVDSFADYYAFGFLLAAAPPRSGYTDPLNQLGVSYEIFDARSNAIPSQAQLNSHRCVIWRISDLDAPNTTLAQRITNYVNSGGSLLLASMEATSRFTDVGLSSFVTNVLRVQSYTEDQPVDEVSGIPGEPIGNGINVQLDYTAYSDILTLAGTTDPSDWIVPKSTAAAAIVTDGAIVGLRAPKTGVDLPGRVVFLSFPLDAVPLGSGIGNNRVGLLHNILNFLAPPANTSTVATDRDVYSIPSRATVEVEDEDLSGQGVLSINVHSPQHSNQITLTLFETVRDGLFRGTLIFVPTNSGTPGTYFVTTNDTVMFDYFDASAAAIQTASVTFETNAPIISNVYIEPGYLEALVSWDTSEATDALVQYSESPITFPNNFTEYDPSPTTTHNLFLQGLKTNTTYYVRISCRDRAGNNTLDDNHGTNYVFTTLLPLTTPWFDNIETNNLNWSTFASTDSETEWTRGKPGNGETAHSGTNCWGSNLSGGPVSQIETYLISPGIYLSGGNKATLRFWHNYDFSSQSDFEFQIAELQIITNVASSPIPLFDFPADMSGGWVQAEFDLTPYMGNVVYIVWYHLLFSIDNLPRLGWLVDDVSVTTETIVPGTIQITNNIWQAVYALAGRSGRTANGRWLAITNAAPGQYTIQFGDVPYYNTPPPQTNTLTGGGTITFQGNYTFTDVNSNGIPDSYETAQFGVVDPLRTKFTDTDHDGISDWAEFIAGTDPNNPPSLGFKLTATRLTNGTVRLSWPAVTNISYRVHGSLNTANWTPYADYMSGSGTLTLDLPTPTNSAPRFFRVEAAKLSTIPNLRLKATRLANGSTQLDWAAGIGHGYRVLSSSNLTTWSPATDWIRTSSAAGTATVPSSPGARFFRLEAQP